MGTKDLTSWVLSINKRVSERRGFPRTWFPREPKLENSIACSKAGKIVELQPRCFREVHPEPISPTLIPTRHFRRCMPQLLLYMPLINVSAACKTSTQRMAREQSQAFFFGQFRSNTRVSYSFLDQARNMLVRQAISGDLAIITCDALKQGAEIDLGVMKVLLKRVNRAGLVTRASANLNFAPACFAAERQDQSTLINCNPSFAFSRAVGATDVIAIDVETNDLRTTEATSVTNQKDGPVTLIAQAKRQRCNHIEDVFGQHSFFLHRRASVHALDTGQNSSDVAVLTVESKASLLIMPAKPRETSLNGADG